MRVVSFREHTCGERDERMANIITSCRILCSIVLLFFPAFSPAFYVLYCVSDFGSRLDTIADFVFVVVCLMKMLPVLTISAWLWLWIGMIAVIKVINVISGYIVQKKFVAEHTIMNKVTGAVVFLLPLMLAVVDLTYSGSAVCIIATFAALQEGHFIRTKNQY